MPPTPQPSDLELQALSVLYREGPSTVATVLETLPDGKERAYTTILSVMQSLERKGLVTAAREGRAYIYKPTKSQESILTPIAKDFVLNAFGGSLSQAILQILSSGALTPEGKSAVQRGLNKHRAMAAKKKTTRKAKTAKKAVKTKAAAKRKTAKKAVKRKAAAKKKPAKKAAKKKAAAKRKPAKKAAKKKATKKKVAKKKATKKKAAKKAGKKAAKRKTAAKRKPR